MDKFTTSEMLKKTEAQRKALTALCERYGSWYNQADFLGGWFDLPAGYVAGWVKDAKGNKAIYVGCSPEGQISS